MISNTAGMGVITKLLTLLLSFLIIFSILQASIPVSKQRSMPVQLVILVDYSISKNNTLTLNFIVQAINMYNKESILIPISDPWIRIYSGNKSIYECSYSIHGNISIRPHSISTLLNTTVDLVLNSINIDKVAAYSGKYLVLINSSYYYEIDSYKIISINKNRKTLKPEIHNTNGITINLNTRNNSGESTNKQGIIPGKASITYRVKNIELLSNRKSFAFNNTNYNILKKYYAEFKALLDIILLVGTLIISFYILRGVKLIMGFK
jgi:hypothetical protein